MSYKSIAQLAVIALLCMPAISMAQVTRDELAAVVASQNGIIDRFVDLEAKVRKKFGALETSEIAAIQADLARVREDLAVLKAKVAAGSAHIADIEKLRNHLDALDAKVTAGGVAVRENFAKLNAKIDEHFARHAAPPVQIVPRLPDQVSTPNLSPSTRPPDYVGPAAPTPPVRHVAKTHKRVNRPHQEASGGPVVGWGQSGR